MILAHYTATDGSSTLLVLGIAMLVMGARSRRARTLTLGAAVLAGGVVLGIVHAG